MSPPAAGRPLVLGHRGASAVARENTIDAFRAAHAAGADGVELDVRTTSDDVLVVHHDPRIAGYGPIWNRPFERLRTEQPHVPTLDEAFGACGGMLVDIEIKNQPSEPGFDPSHRIAELVAAWIDASGVIDRVIVTSFTRDTIGALKIASPDITTGQLVGRGGTIEEWIEFAVDDGHEWILPHRRYLKRDTSMIGAAQAAGLSVGVWTVDGRRWLEAFGESGVDAVITNDPAKALDVYSD